MFCKRFSKQIIVTLVIDFSFTNSLCFINYSVSLQQFQDNLCLIFWVFIAIHLSRCFLLFLHHYIRCFYSFTFAGLHGTLRYFLAILTELYYIFDVVRYFHFPLFLFLRSLFVSPVLFLLQRFSAILYYLLKPIYFDMVRIYWAMNVFGNIHTFRYKYRHRFSCVLCS